MKKAFSLLEVLISIMLFSMVLLFLYKTLDITQSTNDFYTQKLKDKVDKKRIKKLFYEDIAHASKVKISFDRFGFAILKLETKNMYHNSFFKHVTYIVSREKSLFRIESFSKFNESELLDSFFSQAYTDQILKNIEVFKVAISKENSRIYTILLKQKAQSTTMTNALMINGI